MNCVLLPVLVFVIQHYQRKCCRLVSDPTAFEVLSQFIPVPLLKSDLSSVEGMTLEQIAAKFPDLLRPSMVTQIDAELVKIK